MRRAFGLWDKVIAFDNLHRAAKRASLGKRQRRSVAQFLERLEPEILALQRQLKDATWRPGKPFCFKITDPKERIISAAPFADRVVHHAIIGPLEPVFDRRMIATSYACRRGKGTHRALQQAQRYLRSFPWFLKLDIAKCFDSLEHDVVLYSMKRILKDRRVLELLERIIRAGGARGSGLPIGSLTSQWFCNIVLEPSGSLRQGELARQGLPALHG